MKQYRFRLTGLCFCISFIIFCLSSCDNKEKSLTVNESKVVKDSVNQMMNLISVDIISKGPIAWLQYFEKSPEFFMASEGQLVFPNADSAEVFISNILVKKIRKINLQWSNVRVDPLSVRLAGIGAGWQEEITDFENNKTLQAGYFTAIAENASKGWQLRNAHWSVKKQ